MPKVHKILAVDDGPRDLELISTYLEMLGYEHETASGERRRLQK